MEHKRLAEQVDQLKELLINEQDFTRIKNRFFDISSRTPLVAESKRCKDEKLVVAMNLVAKQIANTNVKVMELLKYEAGSMLHGVFQLGSQLGSIFYFTDIDAGLMTVCDFSGTAVHSRISLAEADDEDDGMPTGDLPEAGDSRLLKPEDKLRMRRKLRERLERSRKKH
ncbi:MAG: hypothetical protein KDB22_16490 [Planctomycetales bacterium]|nr:hypothetical protein [Planctomycetales bacterium]